MDDNYIFKIILVGDHNTGKTTFMKKLINLDISTITTTIGVDYLIQYRKIDNKQILNAATSIKYKQINAIN